MLIASSVALQFAMVCQWSLLPLLLPVLWPAFRPMNPPEPISIAVNAVFWTAIAVGVAPAVAAVGIGWRIRRTPQRLTVADWVIASFPFTLMPVNLLAGIFAFLTLFAYP